MITVSTRQFRITFFSLLILALLSCTKLSPTNPNDEDYAGDYKFTVNFDSLADISDSLEIFRIYSIPFKVTGNDTFAYFEIMDSLENPISGVKKNNLSNSDSVADIYFAKPYNGKITVRGVRPNGKRIEITSEKSFTVVNPYSVSADTVQGENCKNSLFITKKINPDFIPDSLFSIWNFSDTTITVYGLTYTETTATENYYFVASLMDKFGNSIKLDSINVTISGKVPTLDSVNILGNIILGQKLTFTVFTSNNLKYKAYLSINEKNMFDTGSIILTDSIDTVTTDFEINDTGINDFTFFIKDSTGWKSNTIVTSEKIDYKLPTPKFTEDTITVFKGKKTTLTFTDENKSDGTVYHYGFSTGKKEVITSDNTLTLTFDTTTQITLFGVDKFGYKGPVETVVIKPVELVFTLDSISFPQKMVMGIEDSFSVAVNDTAAHKIEYSWSVENSSQFDTIIISEGVIKLLPSDTATDFFISVFATVNDSIKTNIISDTIAVVPFPHVEFSKDSFVTLLGDTTQLSFSANSSTDSIFIVIGNDTLKLLNITSYNLPTNILKNETILIFGKSEDYTSEADSAIYTVYTNPPSFEPQNGDTTVFINDTVEISVTAYAGNHLSTVTNYFWDTNSDGDWDDTTSLPSIKLTKETSFDDTLFVGCVNSLGDTATEKFKYHLSVKAGTPTVDSISLDTVWINDNNDFTIYFHDINGKVKSLTIDWGDGTGEDYVISSESSKTSSHTFESQKDSLFSVKVKVTDDELQVGEKIFTIAVKLGLPTIDSILTDTAENAIFVNDQRVFYVTAEDSNGFIKKIFVNWSGGTIPEDTINLPYDISLVDTFFTHTFDISDSGVKSVRIWAMDDDSIASSTESIGVTVRVASPVLFGDKADTLWIIVDNDYGNYFYKPNYFDTNGVIDTFFYGLTNDFSSATESTADSFSITIDANNIDKTSIRYVWIKDDDGLVNGASFVVYADSVPPIPSVTATNPADSIATIFWSGKDKKDGDLTEYMILCDQKTIPIDTVSAFKSGYADGSEIGKDFSFSFIPTSGSGTYYYRVIAKDERGSISESQIGNFYFNP